MRPTGGRVGGHILQPFRAAEKSVEKRSLPSSYDGCRTCAILRNAFASTEDYYFTRDLPPLGRILDDSCPSHDPLFRYLKGQLTTPPRDLGFTVMKKKNGRLSIYSFLDGTLYYKEFVVVKVGDENWASRHGRVIDPDWIDVSLIKAWIERCATRHGDACGSPSGIAHVSPDWLIDTSDACVVSGRGISDYVAMSYRWGASEGFRIGTDGFEFATIRKPGTSGRKQHCSYNTAIYHARNSSDEVHLGRRIEVMGAIYASAKLTIVATDGDAASGIKRGDQTKISKQSLLRMRIKMETGEVARRFISGPGDL
ncbi:hypothetical protein F5X98DRAFT_381289 [Xylaria grammica]|nr:hypothetical protein F5X98DRAFT_381289 [Xylaria grammica]